MSGITGIFSRTGVPLEGGEGGAAQAMLDSIRHRGPDGLRLSGLGPATFGQAMLWTTQESLAETLPCRAGSGDLLLLTADARIDNRDELLAEFGEELANASEGAAVSDSALILQSYRKWGDSCAEHLLGDFAFAVYDARRGGVFCARDHFGVKPFYYSVTPEWFVFGSEQKALFASGLVSDSIDPNKVDEYLVALNEDTAGTFYCDVKRLPPASALFVDVKSAVVETYWTLDISREVRLADDDAYAQEFLRLFKQALECRLRSAYPVGSFLSGGLDSSSIAATAAALMSSRGQTLRTFSAVYPLYPAVDESRLILDTAEKAGIDARLIDVSGQNPLRDLRQLSLYHDGPVVGPGMYKSEWLYEIARESGVRIMLDGHDGDSTVSLGFGYLNELALTGRWLTLWRECRELAKAEPFSGWFLFRRRIEVSVFHPSHRRGPAMRFLRRAYFAVCFRLDRFRSHGVVEKPSPKMWDLLSSESGGSSSALRQRAHGQHLRALGYKTEREDHYAAITNPLQASLLESLDQTTAPHQIEARYPLFDKRLVEFCLALPPSQKLRDGFTRSVMRRAMENVLPSHVQWRRDKTDFTDAIGGDLIAHSEKGMDNLLKPGAGGLSQFIKIEAARAALDRFRADADFSMVHFVYLLASVGAWLSARSDSASESASE